MSIKMKQFWLKEWTRKSCKRVKRSIIANNVGLGVGLGWVGLGWVGLGWVGLVGLSFKIFLLFSHLIHVLKLIPGTYLFAYIDTLKS